MNPSMPEILIKNYDNPSVVKEFLKRYRVIDVAKTPSNIPTACILKGSKANNIEDIKRLSGDDYVFVYWDEGDSLRKEKIGRIDEFWKNREPWEDYDFCIFPETLEWCIGFTHNDYCVLAIYNDRE